MTYVTAKELSEAKRIFKAVPLRTSDCEIPNADQDKIAGCKAVVIISKAHDDASLITRRAQDQATQTIEKAKKDGFAQGQADARKHYEDLCSAMVKSMQQMEAICQEMRENLRESIISLGLDIAAKTIKEQINLDPTTVYKLADEVLSAIAPSRDVVIRLSPNDFEALKDFQDKLESTAGYPDKFKVSPDASLGRGDVVVNYECGTVDAKITTQLGNIAKSLMGQIE